MSNEVIQQIQAIVAEKMQRTDAQNKIEPALLYAARNALGQPQFPNAPTLQFPNQSAKVDTDGQVLVDIGTTTGAGALADLIRSLGGSVISSFPEYNAMRAKLPVTALETLAASPLVKNIRTAEEPATNKIDPPPSLQNRSENVRAKLTDALNSVGTGTTISEAVVAHGADSVQNAGVKGAGVKICVMSNGVSTIAARESAGELPTVQILSTGQAGTSGDEGTAMLELVADMAPGASLGFSTGNGGQAQMAANIVALRNSMSCNIIVDDLTYFAEGAFQEDVIANAVTSAVNAGAMYFSSAANSGHLTGGQSGTWEGDFVNGGPVSGPISTGGETGNFHNFGSALFDTLTASTSLISLKWSDPQGASANDYDLFVLDSTGTSILGSSTASQTGTQNPYEATSCGGTCPSGAKIYIVQFAGSSRALRLDTNRGRLSIGTAGSTFGHNAGVNTITVAAVSNNFQPINRRFLASDTTTTYSSDGPRQLFLNPVPATTAITPGCVLFSCSGGTTLQKVDIAAADCDTTTTPGFTPFCGTSAAAPNSAAIAALIKSKAPGLSNAQVLARMKFTALDIMAAGVDRDSGSGIVMADAAINNKATHDFNGEGFGDILWRDTSGNVAVWEMNGTAILNQATSFVANVPGNWSVFGNGDYNGDGKSDILWRDTSGNVAIWEMNGTAILNQATSFVANVPGNWTIVGTGDFNGDGKSDVLWRDSSGNVAIWEMNGTAILNQATSFVANVPGNWSVFGSGDYNGDGKSDILWRDTSGNVAIWEMNGTTILNQATSFVGNVPGNWTIVGTGDFNGDGRSDILWHDSTGNVAIWEMNGTTVLNQATSFVANVPGTWAIYGSGDYNGAGKSDILWRDGSGNVAIWEMSGTTVLNASTSFVANVPNNWLIRDPQGN